MEISWYIPWDGLEIREWPHTALFWHEASQFVLVLKIITTDQQTDDSTDGPTDKPTDTPTDGPRDRPMDKPTDGPMEGPMEGPTDRMILWVGNFENISHPEGAWVSMLIIYYIRRTPGYISRVYIMPSIYPDHTRRAPGSQCRVYIISGGHLNNKSEEKFLGPRGPLRVPSSAHSFVRKKNLNHR